MHISSACTYFHICSLISSFNCSSSEAGSIIFSEPFYSSGNVHDHFPGRTCCEITEMRRAHGSARDLLPHSRCSPTFRLIGFAGQIGVQVSFWSLTPGPPASPVVGSTRGQHGFRSRVKQPPSLSGPLTSGADIYQPVRCYLEENPIWERSGRRRRCRP